MANQGCDGKIIYIVLRYNNHIIVVNGVVWELFEFSERMEQCIADD